MPRSLSNKRRRRAELAAWLIPVLVLLFAGGIVIARVVAPNDAPQPLVAAETPAETETGVVPSVEPTVATPTPFVPRVALPARKLEGADLAKAVRATVTEVIDGDTVLVQFEDAASGPDLSDVTVRVFGIDAPEVRPEGKEEKCGPEAEQQLKAVLRPGTEVLLLSDKRDKDRFDRLLRYVFLPDGSSIDAGMVIAGLAKAWTQDGAFKGQIKELEADASLHSRGCLWGAT